MDDKDSRVLENALKSWRQFHSPPRFVVDVLRIIRDVPSIDYILSHLLAKERSWVIKELRSEYGPDVDLSGEWGMAARAYVDIEQAKRDHEAFVAHARTVAIPAIRAWLAAHPAE